MVGLTGAKIIDENGKEDRFDSKVIERDLKSAGMADCIATLVAERVEQKVQNGWTTKQVWEETDLELKRLEEDIQRAHISYNKSGRTLGSSTQRPIDSPRVIDKVELKAK